MLWVYCQSGSCIALSFSSLFTQRAKVNTVHIIAMSIKD